MKKQVTIDFIGTESQEERKIEAMIAELVNMPAEWLRRYYSAIIGRELSRKQSWLITRTELAFLAVVVCAGQSVLLTAASLVWFATLLLKCKRNIKL